MFLSCHQLFKHIGLPESHLIQNDELKEGNRKIMMEKIRLQIFKTKKRLLEVL